MEKKTLNYPFIATLIVAIGLLFIVMIPKHDKVITDYNLMSAGQLLDVQLELEKQINVLVDKKKEVQTIRDTKTADIRGEQQGLR